MGLFAFLLRASRGVVVLSALAGLTGGVCGVALIALIHAALERPGPGGVARGLGLAFLVLCLVALLSRVLAQATMVRLAQATVCRLGLSLCRRLLSVPLRTFEGLDPAGVLAILTVDIEIVANALAGIPLLGINLPIVAVCLAYVGWLSPALLATGVAFAALAIVVYQALATRALLMLGHARAGQDSLVAHFRALIAGFRELKQHHGRREAFFADGLQAAAETVRDRNISGLTFFALAGSWGEVAFFGFIGALLFAFAGVQDLGRDVIEGVVLIVLYIMTPLDVILTWLPTLGRAQVSLRRIEALGLALEQEAAETESPTISPPRFASEIALEGVTHAYDQDEFVLGPIDLTLRRGELVFLTGGNGSGKTTLVKLLAGLYTPAAGTIRLDGQPVTPDSLEAYRQLFSVVFVDGYVFAALLGLDRPGLDGAAGAVLERLGLDDRVEVAAGEFSTLDLSQGQKKRLALLTAWLEDRPIIVLDESAANQDTAFKRFFYHELLPDWRRRGQTLLVITHDEDYFDVADRVLRLDAGRLRDVADEVAIGESHR
ncbi:MAG: putative pyoverdin transport system ATP-binding/permease protein [Chloroflexota bacterium]|jgi:putative ATP-binding cassette transporter|nr:putative pyoverdin transport system ATP-binding/permease protein [Chloroflexota bacterium]